MKHQLKIFVTLAYAAIFLVFVGTGALLSQASELAPQSQQNVLVDGKIE